MSNPVSAISILPTSDPNGSRLSESRTSCGDERPFSQWLAESFRERPRSDTLGGEAESHAQPPPENPDAAPDEPTPDPLAASGCAALMTNLPTDEVPPEAKPADLVTLDAESAAPGESSAASLLALPIPSGAAAPASAPLPNGAATGTASDALPSVQPSVPANGPAAENPAAAPGTPSPLPPPSPELASAAEPLPTIAAAPAQAPVATEAPAPTEAPDPVVLSPSAVAQDAATPESTDVPAPSMSPTPEATDPAISDVADDALLELAQAQVPPAVAPPPAASSTTSAQDADPMDPAPAPDAEGAEFDPIQEAASSGESPDEFGSESFQSQAERLVDAAAHAPSPLAPASSATPSASPAPSVPTGSPGASFSQCMQPATLAANLDQLVLRSIRADSNSIRIELEPATLGRVLVQCRETGEGLSVEITVQNGQIRSLLAGQEQDLRANLESQGLQMGRYSVNCRDGDGRTDGDRAGQRRDRDSADPDDRRGAASPAASPAADAGPRTRAGMRNRWVA